MKIDIEFDGKSITQENVGGKILALTESWVATRSQDWKNAISYLKPSI